MSADKRSAWQPPSPWSLRGLTEATFRQRFHATREMHGPLEQPNLATPNRKALRDMLRTYQLKNRRWKHTRPTEKSHG